MTILPNASLQPFNTLAVNALAHQLVILGAASELKEWIKTSPSRPFHIIGGGSNILIVDDLKQPVLLNRMKGIGILKESSSYVLLEVAAGESWAGLVQWCINRGYGGLENLSLIPGTVGAAPIQNIGAYGVELSEVFVYLEAIELKNGNLHIMDASDCAFGYRDSIFKGWAKDQFFISKVILRLTKVHHRLHLEYGAIRQQLEADGVKTPTISDIGRAVVHIRRQKLPDPSDLPNAGSFFKNPEVGMVEFQQLQQLHPGIVHFPTGAGKIKLSAGWLIEQCNWRGRRIGNTGCYEKQALVIVNYGGADGKEILAFSEQVKASVFQRFAVNLEREVNITP